MLIKNTSELNINTESIGGFKVNIIPKGIIEVPNNVGEEILNRFGFLQEGVEQYDAEIIEDNTEIENKVNEIIEEEEEKEEEEKEEEKEKPKPSFFKKVFEFNGKQYKTKAAMKAAKTRAKNKK